MNARKYGMNTAALLGVPIQRGPVKLGKTKKHEIKTKVCCCVNCGAAHTTLYKFGENGKDRICARCYDKHISQTMAKLAGGIR